MLLLKQCNVKTENEREKNSRFSHKTDEMIMYFQFCRANKTKRKTNLLTTNRMGFCFLFSFALQIHTSGNILFWRPFAFSVQKNLISRFSILQSSTSRGNFSCLFQIQYIYVNRWKCVKMKIYNFLLPNLFFCCPVPHSCFLKQNERKSNEN